MHPQLLHLLTLFFGRISVASWEEVIADAVERQEYVDVEETTTGGVDTEVCADVLGTGRSVKNPLYREGAGRERAG